MTVRAEDAVRTAVVALLRALHEFLNGCVKGATSDVCRVFVTLPGPASSVVGGAVYIQHGGQRSPHLYASVEVWVADHLGELSLHYDIGWMQYESWMSDRIWDCAAVCNLPAVRHRSPPQLSVVH